MIRSIFNSLQNVHARQITLTHTVLACILITPGCAVSVIGQKNASLDIIPIGTTRSVDCTDLPDHAAWNVNSSATQTWDGSAWLPSDLTATYDLNVSSIACHFVCNVGYVWIHSACNPSGTLDSSFGTAGISVLPETVITGLYTRGLKVDSQGRILVGYYAGSGANQDIKMRRLSAAGASDDTFGTSGLFSFAGPDGNTTSPAADYLWGITIDSDDRPLIFGEIRNSLTALSFDALIMRVTTAGALDTATFGATGLGYFLHDGASGNTNREDLMQGGIQDSNGKYVVAGNSYFTNATDSDAVIWRINLDGTLDPSFNGTGYRVLKNISVSNTNEVFYSVAEDSQGRLVACGYAKNSNNNDFFIVRLTPTGTLDTSFNSTGYRVIDGVLTGTSVSDSCIRVVIDSEDRIIAGGVGANSSGDNDLFLLRLNEDGTVDSSYGSSGKIVLSNLGGNSTSNDNFYDMIIDQHDRVTLVAQTQNTNPKNLGLLARVTASGALDTSFNSTGYVLMNSNQTTATLHDTFRAVAQGPDQRLFVLHASQTSATPSTYAIQVHSYFP